MPVEAPYGRILRDLIAFPTVSSESNLELIEYAGTLLRKRGFDTEVLPNALGSKANLLARIGPDVAGGVALAGHTDVVPVSGQEWHSEPFELLERNGRLHGRGTADMKGAIALALELAATLDADRLQRPLYLILTYDEEVGCLGALALEDKLRGLQHKPRFALVGEPTDMQLATAHKGIQLMRTRVRGRPGHSSDPAKGASAIEFAACFINGLREILPNESNDEFHPPTTTFNVGFIRGGEAFNIIPEHCELGWEFRHLPEQDPDRILADVQKRLAELGEQAPGISAEHEVAGGVIAMRAGENRHIAAELRHHLKPTEPVASTVPFVTEGGIFQRAGIPTVICGPGQLAQAHQPDEYVAVDAMNRYRDFLQQVISDISNV